MKKEMNIIEDEIVEIERVSEEDTFLDLTTSTENFIAEDLITHNSRPNKKSRCSGYFMPDYLRESIKVLVAVDTSGSIGDKERTDFISEIAGMAKAFRSQIEMIFLTHDTEVHDDIRMENGKIAKIQEMKFHGGGGTSHEPVMDYIEKKHRDTKLAVFLTDGYSDLNDFNMEKFRFNKIFVISEGGSDEQLKGKRCKTIKLEKQYR